MGLSLGKLLVLGAIVFVVWYGFKYRGRIEAVRRAFERERAARRDRPPDRTSRTIAAEDLVKCDRCGSYVAAHATSSCGRADCPWGR
jgi:hypothetical protein